MAQVDSMHGSQDILFPEDAPQQRLMYSLNSDAAYYSPPSSSAYSSYSQEVKYIFDPQYSKPHQNPNGNNNYSEITNLENNQRTDKVRRASYENSPHLDKPRSGSFENSPRLDKPRSGSFEHSPRLDKPRSGSFEHSPRLDKPRSGSYENSPHLDKPRSGSFENSPRLDKQTVSKFSGSPRVDFSGASNYNNSPRMDNSNKHGISVYKNSPRSESQVTNYERSNRGDHQERYGPRRDEKERERERCDTIHEQEIYSAPHSNGPAVRPPPYWSRAYMNGQSANGKNCALLASRRKTWSPPTCSRALSNVTNFNTLRSYRSNDQLDVDDGVYEDLDAVAPPKITPVSGFLNKVGCLPQPFLMTDSSESNAQKSLIKPIAFKPILAPHPARYVPSPQRPSPQHRHTPPTRSHDLKVSNPSQGNHDDGYVSQEYNTGSHSHSTSNTSSQSSYHLDNDRSMSFSSSENNKYLDRSGSYGSSNTSRVSSNHPEGYIQTPSPSDSGVGELETMLRDKDAEIQHLRETMEHNETVIFQVYEEKRQNWAMQLKEVVVEWERRLRHHQQKSFKMEQALLLQLFKLQQERKTLRLDVEQLRPEKERSAKKVAELEADLRGVKRTLEEQQWDTVQKSGEVSLLKAQLKEAKEEASNKTNDLIGVKSQLKEAQSLQEGREKEGHKVKAEVTRLTQEATNMRSELEHLRREISRPKCDRFIQTDESHFSHGVTASGAPVAPPRTHTDSTATEGAVAKLKAELREYKMHQSGLKQTYEAEKHQWLVEKDKVINYQKHLQLNYVQMFRKNKMLELEMEQLMVELENRDMSLTGEQGGESEGAGLESTC